MLLLTSNGLSSDRVQDAAKPLIKGQKAALVVTADNEYKEKNYHVGRLMAELHMLGAEVDVFDFDNRAPSELRDYHVVELMGGNPFYLLHSIRVHGFADILHQFAFGRCVIGCSAGSLVMTRSLELVNQLTPEMNIVEMKKLDALSFTDVEILPHYSKLAKKLCDVERKCAEYEALHHRHVIRLDDGDAVMTCCLQHFVIRALPAQANPQ